MEAIRGLLGSGQLPACLILLWFLNQGRIRVKMSFFLLAWWGRICWCMIMMLLLYILASRHQTLIRRCSEKASRGFTEAFYMPISYPGPQPWSPAFHLLAQDGNGWSLRDRGLSPALQQPKQAVSFRLATSKSFLSHIDSGGQEIPTFEGWIQLETVTTTNFAILPFLTF